MSDAKLSQLGSGAPATRADLLYMARGGLPFNLTLDQVLALTLGRKNFVRNGDFMIAQRGTSFAGITTSQYTLDGALTNGAGTNTVTQQAFTVGQTAVPGNPRNFLQHQRTVAAGVANELMGFPIEFPDFLAGLTITYSFWHKVASGTKALIADIVSNGVTNAVDTTDRAFTSTTSWQKFSTTELLPTMTAVTAGASLRPRISELTALGTFTLSIADVQVEIGSSASQFERLSYAEQALWNYRFYWDALSGDRATANLALGLANPISTTQTFGVIDLPVEMRAPPTMTVSAVASFSLGYPGNIALTVFGLSSSTKKRVTFTATTAGHTATQVYHVYRPGTSATVGFSAEL